MQSAGEKWACLNIKAGRRQVATLWGCCVDSDRANGGAVYDLNALPWCSADADENARSADWPGDTPSVRRYPRAGDLRYWRVICELLGSG